MKLAIYHNLPTGGALHHLSQVARALHQAGHELHLFTPSCAEQKFYSFKDIILSHSQIQREKWTVSRPILNPILYRNYLKKCINQEKDLAEKINSAGFDGIYLGQCQTWTEPPLLKFLSKDLPSILYCAEPKRSFHEERYLKQIKAWPWWKKAYRLPTISWMKKGQYENIQHANKVLCNSTFSQKNISKAYPGIEAEVSYIGVDSDEFQPSKEVTKKHQLISVGALDPSKNHGMAIDIAGAINQKPEHNTNIKFEVKIVTDRSYGRTADELQEKAKALNV
ncbi:MAG: glycosyltransferase, partial [Planctomycetes bacterium]|nr:glycosyltransferase [Planctomycetota bacterium]